MSRHTMSFALPESMRKSIDARVVAGNDRLDVVGLLGQRQDVAAILADALADG